MTNFSTDRRTFVAGAATSLITAQAASAAPAGKIADYSWLSAWEIREATARGNISALEITDHFLQRIATLNPSLHAFSHVDVEGARQQARIADDDRRDGKRLGPLHGVPISVKDHISVRGTPHLDYATKQTAISAQDDIVVERLRGAGAIILGLNTMPGMGWSSGRIGAESAELHPRNPWNSTKVPGSSSAGGAAAVAAAMVPVAIGSDGGGSTRIPAALSGVIGFHPSRGRVPSARYDGSFNLAATHGPITRDMRDTALIMDAIAGPDAREFITLDVPSPDYGSATGSGAKGLKFAWTDDFGFGAMYHLPGSDAVIKKIREAALRFTSLGAAVTPTDIVWEDFWPGNLATGKAYGYSSAAKAMKYPDGAALQTALECRKRNYDKFSALLGKFDFLLSPTVPFTAFTVEDWDRAWSVDGKKYPHESFAPTYTVDTYMFNWIGWPAISIPCGFVGEMPVGMQIIAPPWREASLMTAAAAYLAAFPNNSRPPVA